MKQVTIFLICYNRMETLLKTLESYKKFTTPHEIILIDNGTDHPKCQETMKELEKDYETIHLPPIYNLDELDPNVDIAMKHYYESRKTPYYVVTMI